MKLWIARDKNGILAIYKDFPSKCEFGFLPINNANFTIDRNLFPSVTFENSPKEITIILNDE